MLFFYLLALPAVACATGWALVWLPSRSTGWLVRLDVGLAWFAALATLILVPTDVAAALAGRPAGHLAVWWRAAYWYGFLVQVLVLPLHMEATRSGEFTAKDRLVAAARRNLLYYALLLAVGVAGLFLLLFTRRLQLANILGFCIAFSNAYGLVAAIFLLGFGLVAVPRQLWNSADPHGERRRVCHNAGVQAERALAAHRRLSAAVLTARRASVLFAAHDPLRPYMDTVLSLAGSVGPGFKLDASVAVPDEADLDVFDRTDLANLRRDVKGALKDYEREQALYVEAVQQHLRLEHVIERMGEGVPADAPPLDRLAWLWQCHLHFWAYRLLAALAAMCSLAIVVAEATIAGMLPNMSIVSAALHATAGTQFLTELLCFLFLAYPCACAYYSLYRLGRFAFYRMVPRHTDAYSLCYSALLMCRFAAPLAFNFMAAIAIPEAKGRDTPDVTDTVFYAQFGELMMRQPLIGWQFTTFAPALLVPYMLLLASGVFNHVVGLFKRGEEMEFEDDWQNDKHAAAGRRLLLLESDNARHGLPLGLTLEPAAAAAGAIGGSAAAAAGSSADLAAAAGASSGLLGALRGAAAAAAEEEAAAAAAADGPWWRRLLPLSGSSRGAGAAAGGRSVEAQAARGRLSRLVLPGSDHSRSTAGYSSLPASAPDASAPAGGASRPLRAAARHQRGGSGGGGSGGAGSFGEQLFSSLGSHSPSTSNNTAAGGGRGMKAWRAKYLATAGGGGGGDGSSSGLAPQDQQQQQEQQGRQQQRRGPRGSVDVESGGGGATGGAVGGSISRDAEATAAAAARASLLGKLTGKS